MTKGSSRSAKVPGNPKVSRLRSGRIKINVAQRAPTVQRTPGLGPPIIDFGSAEAALSLQHLLGNQAVLGLLNLGEPVLDDSILEEEQSEGGDPKAAFTQEVLDQIVSDMIAEQLEKYNNISVTIKEKVPVASAEGGQAASAGQGEAEAATGSPSQEQTGPTEQATKTVSKKVKVRAVYFINRHIDKVKAARKAAGFEQIADTIDDQLSELKGGSNQKGYHFLGAGRAVEVGKATPEDIELFMNAAAERGEFHNYGRQEGLLREGEQLVDLGEEALQTLVQDWMYATGVGVDCSGFINIALVRAREKVREEMRAAGVPEEELPKSLARMQRPQLNKKKEVTDPAEMRPGDVWVTNSASHVRVIMHVTESVDDSNNPVIEFVTAESTTSDETGPVEKKWRTKKQKKIGTIKNISGGGTTDGNIYKIRHAI